MLFVKSTKVRRATDRYPACFDQSPAQPLVAKGQELPMPCLAAAGMSGGNHSGVSAQFFRAGKALDRVHFARDDCGQGRSDSWYAHQLPMYRFAPKLQPDPFFLRLQSTSHAMTAARVGPIPGTLINCRCIASLPNSSPIRFSCAFIC